MIKVFVFFNPINVRAVYELAAKFLRCCPELGRAVVRGWISINMSERHIRMI